MNNTTVLSQFESEDNRASDKNTKIKVTILVNA